MRAGAPAKPARRPPGRLRACASWPAAFGRGPRLLQRPAALEEQHALVVVGRDDYELRRVLAEVVLAERAAEVEAPVAERQAVELEADQLLPRRRLPAELRRVLRRRREQDPVVVAELEREPRRRQRLVR